MRVPAEGPLDAKIVIVGEAPGEKELAERRPFVGYSGRILDGLLREVGIAREQCYVTNLVKTRPEGNDFGRFYEDAGRKHPTEILTQALAELRSELKPLNPHLVLCLGAEPLRWLTGQLGIEKWRGSILPGLPDYGGLKTLASFHPAAIGREWGLRACAVSDFHRAAAESAYPDIRRTPRELIVPETYQGAIYEINRLRASSQVAFDIETTRQDVSCIGFSVPGTHRAICIPFCFKGGPRRWSADQELSIWDALRELLTDERIGKIAHNGSFDVDILERAVGFRVSPLSFDTMLGFHALQLELPKALSFLTSLYTDHPYYKDDLNAEDAMAFWRYNATDACLTGEIALKLMADLHQQKMWDFYKQCIHSLWEPLHEMQLRGVNFDYLKRNSLKKRAQEHIAVLQKRLDTAVGRPLNVNSSLQMKEWLYGCDKGGLALKPRTKRRKATGAETVTTDEETLEEIYKDTKNEALNTILKIRGEQKILSTYLEAKLDEDQRMRCSWCIAGAGKGEKDEGGTETGRLSSRKTQRSTGGNLQNIPAGSIRSLILPDPGQTLINADLSQAEARIVAYLSDESRLIRVFEEGGDIHRRNASVIFKLSEDAVSDSQRQLAKRVVHASNYGMGYITFAKQCGIPTTEARKLLNQYHTTYPGIQNWHRAIQSQLRRYRYLVTPFGRRRYFWARWGEGLFKEAYAFVPQSTVADIVNQALILLHQEGYEILIQCHDSLLLQVPNEMVDEAVPKVLAALQRPIIIHGRPVSLPADAKTGLNWQDLKIWETTKKACLEAPIT